MRLRRGKKPARAFSGPGKLEPAITPKKSYFDQNPADYVRRAEFYEGPGTDEMIRAEKGPRRPFKFEDEKPEPAGSPWDELRKSYKKIVKDSES